MLSTVITYEVVFGEKLEQPIETLLRGINKQHLRKFSHFLLKTNLISNNLIPWREVLGYWFSKENEDFYKFAYNKFSEVENQERGALVIHHPKATLKLIQATLSGETDNLVLDNKSAEINLFKAYLAILSNLYQKDDSEFIFKLEVDERTKLALMLTKDAFSNSEFINFNSGISFRTQLVKANLLFNFLSTSDKYVSLLKEFLKELNISKYEEYLRIIVSLLALVVNHPTQGWLQINFENFENLDSTISTINMLSINAENYEEGYDFNTLRNKPLFHVDKKIYEVLYIPFLIDKLYKSLYFKFKFLYDSISVKRPDFRGSYCYDFSERYLFYQVMKYIYGKHRCTRIQGDKMGDGYCDYYLRKGKHIFLFECKDILISAKAKEENDLELFVKDIKLKLYENQKGDPKAIKQLINNIELVLKQQFIYDTLNDVGSLTIYPVIVLYDQALECVGLSQLLNFWFEEELKHLSALGVNISNVRPVSLVNIDTLILYADCLKLKKGDLRDWIESYINVNDVTNLPIKNGYQTWSRKYQKGFYPFNTHVHELTKNAYMKYESYLNLVYKKLAAQRENAS